MKKHWRKWKFKRNANCLNFLFFQNGFKSNKMELGIIHKEMSFFCFPCHHYGRIFYWTLWYKIGPFEDIFIHCEHKKIQIKFAWYKASMIFRLSNGSTNLGPFFILTSLINLHKTSQCKGAHYIIKTEVVNMNKSFHCIGHLIHELKYVVYMLTISHFLFYPRDLEFILINRGTSIEWIVQIFYWWLM
jgi:hypothetical protein